MLSITDYGVIRDYAGTSASPQDISGAFQTALNDAVGKALFIPNGTYLIDSSIVTIPSNTHLVGESHGAVIQTGANIPLYAPGGDTPSGFWALRNSDWIGGNSNIALTNLGFKSPVASNKGACHFRNVTNLRVSNCRFDFGGPSATRCTDYTFFANYLFDCINAGIDNWDACVRGVILANHMLGNGSQTYGVLVTGITTLGASSPCTDVRVIGNTVRNVTDLGIWFQGNVGAVRDSLISGNLIDTITAFHGLRVSDSERIAIIGNHLKNLNNCGINFQTEGLGGLIGRTQDSIIKGNTVFNSNLAAAAGVNAVENHAGNRNQYLGNLVTGGAYKFAWANSGTGNRLSCNGWNAGVSGVLNDTGVGTITGGT